MAGLLEGGYDLAALSALYIAIGCLVIVAAVVDAVASAFDFSLFGYRPLHSIATGLHNAAVGALDGAIKDLEKVAAGFESGLIDSFGLLIAIPLLLGLGIKAALEYFWSSALRPVIHSITDTIRTTATAALSKVVGLEGAIASNLSAAEAYARGRATAAIATAEAYVESRIGAAEATLRGDIAGALSAAEGYADVAVSKLRAAEDAAVAGAVAIAAEAKAAGLAAAAAAEAGAERAAGSALAQSEAAAARALAEAQAAGAAALGAVSGLATGALDDLATIEGDLGALGTAGLIAAIPALATLVRAIATEAGLESAACRSKVKGICGTDPSAWAGLLEGALLLTGALSLRELVPVGRVAVHELSDLIKQAA